jgi:hypothetical protein
MLVLVREFWISAIACCRKGEGVGLQASVPTNSQSPVCNFHFAIFTLHFASCTLRNPHRPCPWPAASANQTVRSSRP